MSLLRLIDDIYSDESTTRQEKTDRMAAVCSDIKQYFDPVVVEAVIESFYANLH
jgi:hypothetical protein